MAHSSIAIPLEVHCDVAFLRAMKISTHFLLRHFQLDASSDCERFIQ